VTSGDFTRLLEREERWLDVRLEAEMRREPQVAHEDELGSAAVYRMEQRGIMAMPVLDGDARLAGVVHLHDLMRAGAV
jgi:arabinose-5-phosphate isomerase